PAPGPVSAASAAEDQASRRITVVSPGIEVTAAYDTDPALVEQILASASPPLPAAGPGNTSAGSTAPGSTAPGGTANTALRMLAPAAAAAAVPASATSYTGQGFDAC